MDNNLTRMLEPSEVGELVKIAERATKEMTNLGHGDFLLESISWDDKEGYWVVRFYCERGNIEKVGIAVARRDSDYQYQSLVFD